MYHYVCLVLCTQASTRLLVQVSLSVVTNSLLAVNTPEQAIALCSGMSVLLRAVY
jgi:hypothetical protein